MQLNFSDLCDEINAKQIKVDLIKNKAATQTKEMELEIDDLEQKLLVAMKEAGLKKIKGKASEAEIKPVIRISIKDFEAFQTFAIRKKALHLFERRIGSNAYKEMKASLGGKEIPGLSEFEFDKLNVKRA